MCGTISALGNGAAPQSSYSIDGGAQTNYAAVQQAGAQYKQCFFRSGTLSSTIHTLVIQNTADGGDFYLDYLSVVSLDPSAVTSPTGSSSAVTATASSLSSKSTPVGAIVGGILAALVVIGLVVAGALYRKRKRASQRPGMEGGTGPTQTRSRGSREWHRFLLFGTSSLICCFTAVVTPFVPPSYATHGSDYSESAALAGHSTSHSASGWSSLAGTSHKRYMSTAEPELPPPQYE